MSTVGLSDRAREVIARAQLFPSGAGTRNHFEHAMAEAARRRGVKLPYVAGEAGRAHLHVIFDPVECSVDVARDIVKEAARESIAAAIHVTSDSVSATARMAMNLVELNDALLADKKRLNNTIKRYESATGSLLIACVLFAALFVWKLVDL